MDQFGLREIAGRWNCPSNYSHGSLSSMASGRIVVTTGPERGKVFEIEEELVHVGRAAENQIVLDDPSLSEHQASILNKNGRFAIYRPDDAEVNIDGNDIPAEKWVWLPTSARLQFGLRTTCQFSYEQTLDETAAAIASVQSKHGQAESHDEAAADESQSTRSTASAPKAKTPHASSEVGSSAEFKRQRSKAGAAKLKSVPQAGSTDEEDDASQPGDKRKKKKRKRQTARFITDQGNPLVELGADGQLPELALDEAASSKQKSDKSKPSSPALMYAILAFSFLSTLGMLFLDTAPGQSGSISKTTARVQVKEFWGNGDNDLKPFQRRLRAAQLARSRADYGEERRLYLGVLAELNSEDRDLNIGVTGSLNGDVDLKKLIGVLISQ